ncbi:hypothetical protein [Cohnella soli]|uniref:Uncharacterized protein n=1 Tax=Cohnella soli TaxID=425005 RepID=A0ABW0HWB1_9BACL
MTKDMRVTGEFDWSLPRFLPLKMETFSGCVTLSAGGETVHLSGSLFRAEASGELTTSWKQETCGDGFTVLSLELTVGRNVRLDRVCWMPGIWEKVDVRLVHSTELQDNFLFLRKGNISFFLSLDYPGSRISEEGIYYEPLDELKSGVSYACHTLSIGACSLSGEVSGDYDRAEIEAVSTYIEQRFPLRFERPVFGTTCITNRMTDVRDGRVFFSMFDNPTLALSPEILEREIDLCAEAGIEYYQVFEGVFDWPEDDSIVGETLRRLVAYGAERGVRIGDYVHPGELYCPHYNYEQRCLDRPEWRQLDAEGKRGQMCLGNKAYAEFLRSRLVEHNRKYGEQMICLDMLFLYPCYDPDHGHPVGDVYHQVRGLVELMTSLADLHPEYLIWTNSGNWLELMPKLVWFNPNIYLTDPHVREYTPNLNMLKFMGDTRREQMVSFHNSYMVPYRFYSNCEYYYTRSSRVEDIQYFEYSLLQGLAVTPNLYLGEWRTFLDRVPYAMRDSCVSFLRQWLLFIRTNFELWKHTKQIGDSPGIGAMEAYAHTDGHRGFLCLINANPFPGMLTIRLDGSIGLKADATACFDLYEIYPQECPIAEHPLPFAEYGEMIECQMPPHSVRYIEIKPHVKPLGLKVFGLPADAERTMSGYRMKLTAPIGKHVPLKLLLPEGENVAQASARPIPMVPMFTFPTQAHFLGQQGHVATVEVVFPRTTASRELTHWKVLPGGVEIVLPQPGCPFLGGLVSGAYSEESDVWLDIELGSSIPALAVAVKPHELKTEAPAHWNRDSGTLKLETDIHLPFIEWDAFAPGYGADTLIELAFADPERVGQITATLNGKEVEVRRYAYATRKEWCTYYIVLTGTAEIGNTKLAIEIQWK